MLSTSCVPAVDIISPDPKTAQELAVTNTDEEIEAQSREGTCQSGVVTLPLYCGRVTAEGVGVELHPSAI